MLAMALDKCTADEFKDFVRFTRSFWKDHEAPGKNVCPITQGHMQPAEIVHLSEQLHLLDAHRMQRINKSADLLGDIANVKKEMEKQLLSARRQLEDNHVGGEQDSILDACGEKSKTYEAISNFVKTLELLHDWHGKVDEIVASVDELTRNCSQMNLSQLYKHIKDNHARAVNCMRIIDCVYVGQSHCRFFQRYCFQIVVHMCDQLKAMYDLPWQVHSSLLQWPTSLASSATSTEEVEQALHFRQLFSLLIKCSVEIQTGVFVDVDARRVVFTSSLSNHGEYRYFQTVTDGSDAFAIVKTLALTFAKRFNYLFNNANSRLGDLSKPEYYFCQIERWITEHSAAILEHVNPILAIFPQRCSVFKQNIAIYMLGQELNILVVDKLKLNIDKFIAKRTIFLNTIKESFKYMKQIKQILPDFWEHNASPCGVLLDDSSLFDIYYEHEAERAQALLLAVFNDKDSWDVIYGRSERPGKKNAANIVTRAVDRFFNMLCNGFLDRAIYVRQPASRHKMADLLLQTLDEFFVNMTEAVHDSLTAWPFSEKLFAVVNSITFALFCVQDIFTNPYLNSLLDASATNKIAAMHVERYASLEQTCTKALVYGFIKVINKHLEYYREQHWHRYERDGLHDNSEKCVALVSQLSALCQHLQNNLSAILMNEIGRLIALYINDYLVNQIILAKRFNREGALQLRHDVNNCIKPSLSVYFSNIDNTFNPVSDCLIVLTCHEHTYIKLSDLVKRKYDSSEMRAYMNCIGITCLGSSQIKRLIAQRLRLH